MVNERFYEMVRLEFFFVSLRYIGFLDGEIEILKCFEWEYEVLRFLKFNLKIRFSWELNEFVYWEVL